MSKIAVQLLIGQNAEPFLPYAIEAVSWADYFTVCNTSPDSDWGRKNEQIVLDNIPKDKLRYRMLWPDNQGHFSFADARNICLESTEWDDFVLIVDADDVHFPQFKHIAQDLLMIHDSVTAYFYHLMVYKNIFQYIQPREIIYRNYDGTHWEKGVHEQLISTAKNPVVSSYRYIHYGYIKPQVEVFNRWKFYSDLTGDTTHYEGQNPHAILDDRVAVCEPLPIEHPTILDSLLNHYPDSPTDAVNPSPRRTFSGGKDKVGLVLLTMDDEHQLDMCLGTLAETELPPQFSVLAIDINSNDSSVELLQAWQQKNLFDLDIVGVDEYISLTEALNYGFDQFRMDDAYEYVGWIHPDMEFVQKEWLHNLWLELAEDKKLGKVCSANFRDLMPDKVIDGHEQCYILRKDILHKVGLFDRAYVGIGGYEDWDLNRRIMMHQGPEGFYRVVITPKSFVLHHGMKTRERRDTRQEQISNAQYYSKKWNTGNPPC